MATGRLIPCVATTTRIGTQCGDLQGTSQPFAPREMRLAAYDASTSLELN